jgi:preprotein translocase subunit SecB
MNEVKQAPFTLESFKVREFHFIEPGINNLEMSVKFDPTGKYYSSESRFALTFNFSAAYGDNIADFVRVTMDAFFKFREQTAYEEIPPYFYKNTIAIVFPYLRSFITTLTVISGDKALILPILNLSNLEEELKQNTEAV